MDGWVKIPVPKSRIYRVTCTKYTAHLTAKEHTITDATEPFKWAIGRPIQAVMCILYRKPGLKVELLGSEDAT